MARGKSPKGILHYNNADKSGKNFMYNNLTRSNCYNCTFKTSNFDFTSLRGAHFKSCDFYACSFNRAEFVGANLKNSKFRAAKFENTLFDGVNLEGTDFRDAKFKNTIFLATDVTKAKNLDLNDPNIKVLDKMPDIEISEDLENAIKNAMNNGYIKAARVFDTKDKTLHLLNISILLENFDEETLINGLNTMANTIDKEFCTLSYVIKFINNL